MIIRFLHAYQFKHPKVYKNMIGHMDWRASNLPPKITSNTFNNFLVSFFIAAKVSYMSFL